MLRTTVCLFAVLLPAVAAAQPPSTAPAQKEAMKKLEFLAGKWKGPASITTPAGRQEVNQTEDVRYKLDGLVMVIEGLGRQKQGAGDKVVFQALAVVSYDPASKQYRMRTFTHEGRTADPSLQVEGKRAVWGFEVPGGHVRYTIRINEKNQWHEVGEFSADRQQWRQFFEMTLDRE